MATIEITAAIVGAGRVTAHSPIRPSSFRTRERLGTHPHGRAHWVLSGPDRISGLAESGVAGSRTQKAMRPEGREPTKTRSRLLPARQDQSIARGPSTSAFRNWRTKSLSDSN